MNRMGPKFVKRLWQVLYNAALITFLVFLWDHHTSFSDDETKATPFRGDQSVPTVVAPCRKVLRHVGFLDACEFVSAHPSCRSDALIDYTIFFFCFCRESPLLGRVSLIVWLVALFYILGNTAADYFCSSLDRLSKLLHLSPTVAGVTLLPFGNGAPDVFSSIAAFMGARNGEVGLNSVLGGAVFIVCVVAGAVILLGAGSPAHLDCSCFIRDLCFFLVTLLVLAIIIAVGKISFWGAIAYISIYLVYAVTIAVSECSRPASRPPPSSQLSATPDASPKQSDEENCYMHLPDAADQFTPANSLADMNAPLPQWQWISKKTCSDLNVPLDNEELTNQSWWRQCVQLSARTKASKIFHTLQKLCELLIEWPLSMPRRLTIPTVEEDRWSQAYAISSVTLAPIFIAFVLNTKGGVTTQLWPIFVGLCIGCILGILAYLTTQSDHPPRKYAFAWIWAGFFMSLFWFYFIAKELVAVLVSLGVILDIDPALLALTLLAWGNSSGDLMANIALASKGGDDLQIAISGCYAGPMFNTLIGLGLSLVCATWKAETGVYTIPKDDTLFSTLGFLVIGLLWVLFFLPINNMQPSRISGGGLLVLYALFLIMQITSAVGFIPFKGSSLHT